LLFGALVVQQLHLVAVLRHLPFQRFNVPEVLMAKQRRGSHS
jgi:hypothetical protein